MGLLDDDYKPRFTPKKGRVYRSEHDSQTEEQKLTELNNLERKENTEDFADSPHADRK